MQTDGLQDLFKVKSKSAKDAESTLTADRPR